MYIACILYMYIYTHKTYISIHIYIYVYIILGLFQAFGIRKAYHMGF